MVTETTAVTEWTGPSNAISDGGRGVRFMVHTASGDFPAFAIRYRGQVFAYLNRCGHLAVELDWSPGDFFDASGDFLICATHGARYHPGTGACVAGRCNGRGLIALVVEERDGVVRIRE